MSKRKNKRFPKNNRQERPQDTFVNISFGGLSASEEQEMMHKFTVESAICYKRGQEDKERAAAALTLNEFIKKFYPHEIILTHMDMIIVRAQHSTYIDGYTGAAYRDRVTFERDF